jgi:hypothetical protein
MGLLNLINPDQLVNATQVTVPQLQVLVNIINNLYMIVGGVVGLSIIFIILRWREAYLWRRRLEDIEEGLLLVNAKLDRLLKGKVKKR